MTQFVKYVPPRQLLLRETPKDSVNSSSEIAVHDKVVIEWSTFYQLCHDTTAIDCSTTGDNTTGDILQ